MTATYLKMDLYSKNLVRKNSEKTFLQQLLEYKHQPTNFWRNVSTKKTEKESLIIRRNHPDGNSLPKNPEENSLPQKIWRNVSTKKVWEGVSTKKYLEPWRQISTQQKLWRGISTKQSPKIDFIPTPSQITLTKCANKTLKRNSLPKKMKKASLPKNICPKKVSTKNFCKRPLYFCSKNDLSNRSFIQISIKQFLVKKKPLKCLFGRNFSWEKFWRCLWRVFW